MLKRCLGIVPVPRLPEELPGPWMLPRGFAPFVNYPGQRFGETSGTVSLYLITTGWIHSSGRDFLARMKARLLVTLAALALLARAEQASPSRLVFTPPEGWRRSVDAESHLTSYAPPGGGASVTFLTSADFSGSAEEWQRTMWSQVLGEMSLAGPSTPGMQGKFLTRMGVFAKNDGTHPWICLFTAVLKGRGEGVLYYATDDKMFLQYLAVVNHMIQRTESAVPSGVPGMVSTADESRPLPTPNSPVAASDAPEEFVPELVCNEPANFYRGADASPIEYSSRDVECSVLVYQFRTYTGDVRAAFQQSLLRDWIIPQYREGQLSGPPEFASNAVPGADAVLTARFHDRASGLPNERLRILIVAGNQAALVDVVANSAQSWQQASAGFNPMLASLRVERKPTAAPQGPPPAPGSTIARPQAAAFAGLFRGTKPKYVANLQLGPAYGSSKVALHYYLFSANGRVYCCYDFPPGGSDGAWRSFDFDTAQRNDPVNTGRYGVRGNQITIQMSEPGATPITGAIRDPALIEIDGVKYAREP